MTEVRITDERTGGQKGSKAERMSLVPWSSVRAISTVFGLGAKKYDDPKVGPYNWRRGYKWSLSFDALQRHLTAWWDGEDKDSEFGTSHLLHAGWHILVLIWFEMFKPELDDRPHTYFRSQE